MKNNIELIVDSKTGEYKVEEVYIYCLHDAAYLEYLKNGNMKEWEKEGCPVYYCIVANDIEMEDEIDNFVIHDSDLKVKSLETCLKDFAASIKR